MEMCNDMWTHCSQILNMTVTRAHMWHAYDHDKNVNSLHISMRPNNFEQSTQNDDKISLLQKLQHGGDFIDKRKELKKLGYKN